MTLHLLYRLTVVVGDWLASFIFFDVHNNSNFACHTRLVTKVIPRHIVFSLRFDLLFRLHSLTKTINMQVLRSPWLNFVAQYNPGKFIAFDVTCIIVQLKTKKNVTHCIFWTSPGDLTVPGYYYRSYLVRTCVFIFGYNINRSA